MKDKNFDAVRMMREIRDKLSEIYPAWVLLTFELDNEYLSTRNTVYGQVDKAADVYGSNT